jgi:UDP-glucose 4-epimerase
MRVLVTGGAGFIGSYLIPNLLSRGYQVGVFDIKTNLALLKPVSSEILYIHGDLGKANDIYEAVEKFRPNGIMHLGAILAGLCEENPRRCFEVNFGSTQVFLEAALKFKVEKFFMTSSVSVFGRDVPEPVMDNAPKNPGNIYGQTKLASEHLMLWYNHTYGLDICAIRPTIVFGPGRSTGITALFTSKILDSMAAGESVLVANPKQRGDWLYVKDVVKAILAIWDTSLSGQRIFNIAGSVHSTHEVIEIARRYLPNSEVRYGHEEEQNSTPYAIEFDDTLARKELGYKPAYSIESAVKEHLEIRKAHLTSNRQTCQ